MSGNGGPSGGASGGTPIIIGQVSASCPSNGDEGDSMSEWSAGTNLSYEYCYLQNNEFTIISSKIVLYDQTIPPPTFMCYYPPPPTHTQ